MRDTATFELMVANTLRGNVLSHYGGLDLIEGPCPWGATPDRMARLPRRPVPRVTRETAGVVQGSHPVEVPMTVLLGADGVVSRARSTTFALGREAAAAAERAVIGLHLEPVRLDGRAISAWTGVIVVFKPAR